jgi:hypothetical protein
LARFVFDPRFWVADELLSQSLRRVKKRGWEPVKTPSLSISAGLSVSSPQPGKQTALDKWLDSQFRP